MKSKREEIGRLVTDKGSLERRLERQHREIIDVKQKLDDSKTPLLMVQQEKNALEQDVELYRRQPPNHAPLALIVVRHKPKPIR